MIQANRMRSPRRTITNYSIIWLHDKLNKSKDESETILLQLRKILNDVKLFTDVDECIDFLTDSDNQKIFMIIDQHTLNQQLISNIHEIPQLEAIFIYSNEQSTFEQWTKIKGRYSSTTTIYEALKQAVKQCNQDSIPVSFISVTDDMSETNLDQLEPSYMYTQIFKEIFLQMEHSEQSIYTFTNYCRTRSDISVNNINKFENEYRSNSAIWWYTYPCFLFSMLNDALRMLESEVVIKMSFFIHDLHNQIREIHRTQFDEHHQTTFTVYRGQAVSKQDFTKLQKTKGGLMSFNNFLSTSQNHEVPLGYAISALSKPDSIGILFKIIVDPTVSSAPFAKIDQVSYFQDEQEIIFSMHTIFRIGDIRKIDLNNDLYEVDLESTVDDDQQLRTLTQQIRKETFPNDVGWHRIGQLLIRLGHFDQVEQIYSTVLQQTTSVVEKAVCYYQLGIAKNKQDDFEGALSFYGKALAFYEKVLPPNDIILAQINHNIGAVYIDKGEYLKALPFQERALEIKKTIVPTDGRSLGNSYNSIGMVYEHIAEYSKALSFYEKALDAMENYLPSNHPYLATVYNNIGRTYGFMEEYGKALPFHDKALKIREKTLPTNHPEFAQSYSAIGNIYLQTDETTKAQYFFEKALELHRKILPSNHHLLAQSYNNLGLVYLTTEDYSRALEYFENAIAIAKKTLPTNHPLLATINNNTGDVFLKMGNYLKALSYYQHTLNIRQHSLPMDHPDLKDIIQKMTLVKMLL